MLAINMLMQMSCPDSLVRFDFSFGMEGVVFMFSHTCTLVFDVFNNILTFEHMYVVARRACSWWCEYSMRSVNNTRE